MPTGNGSNTTVVSQLAVLIERVETQGSMLADLKSSLNNIDKRLQLSEQSRSDFRAEYERNHAVLDSKTEAAHRRIDEHVAADLPKWAEVDALKLDVKIMRDNLISLKHTNQLLGWFSGVIGSTLIIWVMGNLLGLIK